MREIVQLLIKLFNTASRISVRAGRGILQHGTGKYAVRAVRSLNIVIQGTRISYEALNEFDKLVVDEVVEYATRFAFAYIDHHDENTRYRIQANTVEEVMISHAREIKEAAERALYSKLRSHGYDLAAGKPQRVALFQEEDLLKQLVMAIIEEISQHIDENAERG